MTYSYPLLPVMVQQLRERPYGTRSLSEFVNSARQELRQREEQWKARRPRRLNGTSQSERRFLARCHEHEDRFFTHAYKALEHLERFESSRDSAQLSECLLSYVVADGHFEQGVKLRKNTPLYSELLVRGAA